MATVGDEEDAQDGVSFYENKLLMASKINSSWLFEGSDHEKSWDSDGRGIYARCSRIRTSILISSHDELLRYYEFHALQPADFFKVDEVDEEVSSNDNERDEVSENSSGDDEQAVVSERRKTTGNTQQVKNIYQNLFKTWQE